MSALLKHIQTQQSIAMNLCSIIQTNRTPRQGTRGRGGVQAKAPALLYRSRPSARGERPIEGITMVVIPSHPRARFPVLFRRPVDAPDHRLLEWMQGEGPAREIALPERQVPHEPAHPIRPAGRVGVERRIWLEDGRFGRHVFQDSRFMWGT